MNHENNFTALDEAILGSVLGLSAIFFSLNSYFSPENQINFISLIVIYATASMIRLCSLLFDSDFLKESCEHYCRILMIPFTLWAFISIVFTELHYPDLGILLSVYVFSFSEGIILTKYYGIKFRFRFPIKIDINGKKSKNTRQPNKT